MLDIWVVEQRLGGGGMGTVYRCHNRDAKRIQAAIKVLDPRFASSQDIRRRFVREAELLFELDHPHIVKVRNIRMDADPPFIEMAFVEGASLAEHLERGALKPGAAARLVGQIASALAHCHTRGVNHRDVKPANILVRGGHATLVDFGIAAEASGTITQGGATVGSLSYTPPEWGSVGIDAALWDAYGLGVVLFEALTGRMAFPQKPGAGLREEVIRQIDLKRGLEHLDPGGNHDPALRTLVKQLTASNPAHRMRDLQSVARQLTAFADGRDDTFIADIERVQDSSPDTLALPGSRGSVTPMAPLPPEVAIEPTGPVTPVGRSERPPVDPSVRAAETMAFMGDALPEADGRDSTPAQGVLDPPAVSAPETSSGPAPARKKLSPLGAAAVGLLLAGGAALAWIQQSASPDASTPPPPPAGGSRPVQVQATGDTLGQAVVLRLDGRPVEPGSVQTVEVGPHRLEARLGDGCADNDPSRCLEASRDVTVVAGQGPATIGIALPEAAPVALSVEPALPEGAEVRVDDGDWSAASGLTAPAGRVVSVAVRAGDCPGVGCRESEPVSVTLPLRADAPVPVTVLLPAEKRSAVPRAAASAGGTGRLVTVADLARFLEANPKWQPEKLGSGAPAKYLSGWTGATPPASLPQDRWAPRMSVALAQAVCARRGGLQPFDAQPLTWSGGAYALDQEMRKGDSGVVLRNLTGEQMGVDRSRVGVTVGVRCRR